jgi:hypothetical protein
MLEQLRKLAERRDRLYNWFKACHSREYIPDWLYWLEYAKVNSN